MSALAFALALASATALSWLVESFRRSAARIKRLSGWVMSLVGLWLIATALFAEPLAALLRGP